MMKKALFFVLVLCFSTTLLSAAAKGKSSKPKSSQMQLVFDVGALYTHFSNHHSHGSGYNGHAFNLGGLSFVLRGEFKGTFGFYAMANFGFGNVLHVITQRSNYYHSERGSVNVVYAIDSQFGFFYLFKPVKNLEILLGGGLALGGSGWNRPKYNANTDMRTHCTNLGGGINFEVAYMLTKMIGVYGGLSETMYAPVWVVKSTDSTTTSYTGTAIQHDAGIGRFSNSFSLKAGVQFKL